MRVRILDLDGSIVRQSFVSDRQPDQIVNLRGWGPEIRLACTHRKFHDFEGRLDQLLGGSVDREPCLTFYGSGDFHHVSLAHLRRLKEPFNLLVLDNHPDWVRGLPFLHCGTWVHHAVQLPQVQRVFHMGGDVDFDNFFRFAAPWPALQTGKIVAFPAVRQFQSGRWKSVPHTCLRSAADLPVTAERMAELLAPHDAELARFPLYVSLDKDVLRADEASVNWDSGHLTWDEINIVLDAFEEAARGRWAGADTTGDYSPVRLRGAFRHLLHWTEHPPFLAEPFNGIWMNQRINSAFLDRFQAAKRPQLVEHPLESALARDSWAPPRLKDSRLPIPRSD